MQVKQSLCNSNSWDMGHAYFQLSVCDINDNSSEMLQGQMTQNGSGLDRQATSLRIQILGALIKTTLRSNSHQDHIMVNSFQLKCFSPSVDIQI